MNIPTNLPRGMAAVIMNGAIRYRVRISRNGQRFNLGTFLTAEDAAIAMEKFRCGLHKDLVVAKKEIRSGATAKELEQYQALLDSAPGHLINRDEDSYIYDAESEDIVTVPKHVVNAWLDAYNDRLKNDRLDDEFGV